MLTKDEIRERIKEILDYEAPLCLGDEDHDCGQECGTDICRECQLDQILILIPDADAAYKKALKEVGDEMMKMSTLQEFHALRVRLIQGKLEEK